MMTETIRQEMIRELQGAAEEKNYLEHKLLSGSMQLKLMSGYYAVAAALTAVLSLVYPARNYQSLSVIMTVMLGMWVILLCAEKNVSRAHRLKSEYAALMCMKHEAEEAEEPEIVRRAYLQLRAGEEGITAHERRALQHMHDRAEKRCVGGDREHVWQPRLFGYEKFLYWFAEISLIVMGVLLILAPAAGITLTALGLL